MEENTIYKLWDKLYAYDPEVTDRKKTFVVDTPPPTISGALHIGHVFSYTQTDILVRFQRMLGKNIFYPMGWDNNGLPTEKRVQNLYKIICRPSLPDLSQTLFEEEIKKILLRKDKDLEVKPVTRKEFLFICRQQTKEDQKKYQELWQKLGLSVDWSQTYETISPAVQNVSQKSFLDLYRKGFVENRLSPVFWDTQFKTAVAQADMEDRKVQGFYYDIVFNTEGAESFVISTTRPEMLPACVAVTAHPEDDRYKHLFGKSAVTPLFYRSVPIFPSEQADPEKGTGILMVCTFGDMEDVRFWKKTNKKKKILPYIPLIDEEGFLNSLVFAKKDSGENVLSSSKPATANGYYKELSGSAKTVRVKQARRKIVEMLKVGGFLKGKPKPKEQVKKFYEKGDFPLEIIPARQWYIKILDYKKDLLEQGKKVHWHPAKMQKRYEQWVEGLNQDWCISRQRFFGVPFPLWFALDKEKNINYEKPLFPSLEEFKSQPVDPLQSAPADWNSSLKKYTEDKRGKALGFTALKEVMDTWATSSLSPQINSRWLLDSKRHCRLFPADLRPQAHEIIRTWAFYTIVKSFFHDKDIPWKNIAISGWVMNPERIKMSKSKGNALEPDKLIELYSADAVRYWAGKARLGQDTLFDENLIKMGLRLSVKLKNAFRFIEIQIKNAGDEFKGLADLGIITHQLDQSWIKYLKKRQEEAGNFLKKFHYASALEIIEKSFWRFCDNYLELVKARAYQQKDEPEGLSAIKALDLSFWFFTKMFAPYMPYITEEIWQKRYRSLDKEEAKSVHKTAWLADSELKHSIDGWKGFGGEFLDFTFYILQQIRSFKAKNKKSVSAPVSKISIALNETQLAFFTAGKEDLIQAGHLDPKGIVLNIQKNLEGLPKINIVL